MDIVVLDLVYIHHLHYRLVNGLKMLLFFGVGNSSSRHFVKNKKNLSSWRRTKDGLDDTRINYLSIFKSKKKNRLSIHHMLEALFLC